MRDVDQNEYMRMKEFLSFYTERYLDTDGLPPEKRPMGALEALEKKSLRMASNGLRQAINDCVGMSFHLSPAEVEKLDSQLRARRIVTLSELRRRYSKGYARVVRRGRINDDTEYHLVRNILNDSTGRALEERELLERLIYEYEGA